MSKKIDLPQAGEALPGRATAIVPQEPHFVLQTSLTDYPEGTESVAFGMGCFWGVERLFWQQEGVYTTAAGYCGGETINPTYEQVCTGFTGHNEVVLVVFWPEQLSFQALLKRFWEGHNPSMGMRQGNDVGTQYRSGIYCCTELQRQSAEASKIAYQQQLKASGAESPTTEVKSLEAFYFAEPYHQQYLAKNPGGYCNLQTIDKTGLPIFS